MEAIKGMKINLSQQGLSRRRDWVIDLQRRFAEAHDMKYGAILQSYMSTPNGAKTLANWLYGLGFKVRYWCIEPHISHDGLGHKHAEYIGFGLDFDDKCPMLTEIRLKS